MSWTYDEQKHLESVDEREYDDFNPCEDKLLDQGFINIQVYNDFILYKDPDTGKEYNNPYYAFDTKQENLDKATETTPCCGENIEEERICKLCKNPV